MPNKEIFDNFYENPSEYLAISISDMAPNIDYSIKYRSD